MSGTLRSSVVRRNHGFSLDLAAPDCGKQITRATAATSNNHLLQVAVTGRLRRHQQLAHPSQVDIRDGGGCEMTLGWAGESNGTGLGFLASGSVLLVSPYDCLGAL